MGGRNLNNIRYSGVTVLIAYSEKKLQDILGRVVAESEENCNSIVIIKRKRATSDLRTEDISIKPVQRFKCLDSGWKIRHRDPSKH